MAKIPIYQSSKQLTTESPVVRESPQVAGQGARDLQGAGEALLTAHDAIRKAYDFQQEGTFKLGVMEDMTAVEEKALADGDNTGDLSPYQSEMARSKANRLKGVTNPALKRSLEMSFDLQAAQTTTKIKSMMWTRVKEKSIANLAAQNEYFINEYAQTDGDVSILDAMNKNADTYVKAGIIGADDIEKVKTATILKAKESAFIFDKENNPTLAKEKLAKNAYRFDVEKLAKANEVFDREIKKIQKINQDKIILADINKEPFTVSQIQELANLGKIDADFAKAKIKEIEKDKDVITDEKVYEDIIKDIQTRKLTPTEIFTKICNNSDKLSKTDSRHLKLVEKGGGISTVFEDYVDEQINFEEEKARNQKKLSHSKHNFWNIVSNMAISAAKSSSNPMNFIMSNIIERVEKEKAQGEQIINIATDEIRKQRLRDNPSFAALSKNGQLHEDKFGNKAIVYPDGTYEEVMAKSGEFVHKEARKKR